MSHGFVKCGRKMLCCWNVISPWWYLVMEVHSVLLAYKLWNKNICCLSYTANTMPADALATLGARASAGMVLTPRSEYSVSSIKRINTCTWCMALQILVIMVSDSGSSPVWCQATNETNADLSLIKYSHTFLPNLIQNDVFILEKQENLS